MNLELAANILAKGKRLAPDRFPQPGPETARDWAGALAEVSFPPELWAEAVNLWATKLVGERMVTPRDLIGAAYSVRDRWEADPVKAAVLDELRAARANANYLKAGLDPITVADLPRHAGKPVQAVTERPMRRESPPERLDATKTFPFKRRNQT